MSVSSPRRDIQLPTQASEPKILVGRGKVASGLAVRADGDSVWVVYNSADPHLDVVDSQGTLVQSSRIGGNAEHLASYRSEDVTSASHSPRMVTVFTENGSSVDSEVVKTLNYKCTGLAVSWSGTAISGFCSIFWMARHGNNSQWIVEEDDSELEDVSSLAVVRAEGKEFVCAADQGGRAVHFYRRSLRGGFVPQDPFRPSDNPAFAPVSISAHPAGFLGVLDSVTHRVYIVEVGMEHVQLVMTVEGQGVCRGVPTVMAFGTPPARADGGAPAPWASLWTATTGGHLCLTHLNL